MPIHLNRRRELRHLCPESRPEYCERYSWESRSETGPETPPPSKSLRRKPVPPGAKTGNLRPPPPEPSYPMSFYPGPSGQPPAPQPCYQAYRAPEPNQPSEHTPGSSYPDRSYPPPGAGNTHHNGRNVESCDYELFMDDVQVEDLTSWAQGYGFAEFQNPSQNQHQGQHQNVNDDNAEPSSNAGPPDNTLGRQFSFEPLARSEVTAGRIREQLEGGPCRTSNPRNRWDGNPVRNSDISWKMVGE